MTLTPKNLSTTDYLALCAASTTKPAPVPATKLAVKVYDAKNWKWMDATDADMIDAAIDAARPNARPIHMAGETLYTGDLYCGGEQTRHRVKVVTE